MAQVICKVLNDNSGSPKSLYIDKSGRYYITRAAEDGTQYNCYSSSPDWIEESSEDNSPRYYIICEGRNGKTYKYYSVDAKPLSLKPAESKDTQVQRTKRTVSKLLSVGRLNARKEFILSFSSPDLINSSMYIGIGCSNQNFIPVASLIPKNAKLNSYIVMVKDGKMSEGKAGPEVALSIKGFATKQTIDVGKLQILDMACKGTFFEPPVAVNALDLICLHIISLGDWKDCYICASLTFSYT
jgi:hypothetical protein